MRKSFLFVTAFLILSFCPIDIKATTLSGGGNFSGWFGYFGLNFGGTNSDGRTFSISSSSDSCSTTLSPCSAGTYALRSGGLRFGSSLGGLYGPQRFLGPITSMLGRGGAGVVGGLVT